ncbi:hemolysin III family protein [bacterium]|nr:hemolysin III family protein [bacterium]
MTSVFRPADELANLVTHGLGLIFAIIGTVYLLGCSAESPAAVRWAVVVYTTTLLLVYSCSTLSHAFYDPRWRERFRMLDQASIYLFMAGGYTPFAAVYFHQLSWLWLLVAMWVAACLGVLRVWQVRDLSSRDKLSFGVMGILPMACLPALSRLAPGMVIVWVLAGGICYGLGIPFFVRSASVRYAHAVWHLWVIAGSACHYLAIRLIILAANQ